MGARPPCGPIFRRSCRNTMRRHMHVRFPKGTARSANGFMANSRRICDREQALDCLSPKIVGRNRMPTVPQPHGPGDVRRFPGRYESGQFFRLALYRLRRHRGHRDRATSSPASPTPHASHSGQETVASAGLGSISTRLRRGIIRSRQHPRHRRYPWRGSPHRSGASR